jgi:hypothetical protein
VSGVEGQTEEETAVVEEVHVGGIWMIGMVEAESKNAGECLKNLDDQFITKTTTRRNSINAKEGLKTLQGQFGKAVVCHNRFAELSCDIDVCEEQWCDAGGGECGRTASAENLRASAQAQCPCEGVP